MHLFVTIHEAAAAAPAEEKEEDMLRSKGATTFFKIVHNAKLNL